MKTSIVGIIAALCVAAPLYGQDEKQPSGSKIGVVNMGQVLCQYNGAISTGKPTPDAESVYVKYRTLNDRVKELSAEIKSWDEFPFPITAAFEQLRDANTIRKAKVELAEITKKIWAEKQEDNLVKIWKEINTGVASVAKAERCQIVIGYGDPTEKEMVNQFPNLNRKMQAMDLGGTVPLFVHSSIDLTELVIRTLNRGEKPEAKKDAAPTKIARVNVSILLERYKKSQAYKADVEAALKPYKDKAKVLNEQIKLWTGVLRAGKVAEQDIENCRLAIRNNERWLEDLNSDMQRLTRRKQADSLVILWKDFSQAIDDVANTNGYHLVLGYAGPDSLQSVDRKKQTVDQGGMVQSYTEGSAEITAFVVDALNRGLETKRSADR